MNEERDFFISFTNSDIAIATVLNDALLDNGFSTWFHPLDKPKGAGIASWMENATELSSQMISICSKEYFEESKRYSRAERQSMFWQDPTNDFVSLILVKVRECRLPRLISQLEYIDLMGLRHVEAAEKLIAELNQERTRIKRVEAGFQARLSSPAVVFQVPVGPNRHFMGRSTEANLLEKLVKANPVTLVHGMGGIGKSSLVREFAHYNRNTSYFGILWVNAETELDIQTSFERLISVKHVDVIAKEASRDTAMAVRDWIGGQPDTKRWLLVFDNLSQEAKIEDWLPHGDSKVILISRYQHFEHLAASIALQCWSDSTTVEFINKRSERERSKALVSLASRLNGLPLAAEQVGAFLRENSTISCESYELKLLELIKRAPRKLSGDYSQCVYAVMEIAIRQLKLSEGGEDSVAILNIATFLSPIGVDLDILTGEFDAKETLPKSLQIMFSDEIKRGEALGRLISYSLAQIKNSDEMKKSVQIHSLLAEVSRDCLKADQYEFWLNIAAGLIARKFPKGTSVNISDWDSGVQLSFHVIFLKTLFPEQLSPNLNIWQLLHNSAEYFGARGDFFNAIDNKRLMLKWAKEMVGEGHELVGRTMAELAMYLMESAIRKSDREAIPIVGEAEETYEKSISILKNYSSEEDLSFAGVLMNYSRFCGHKKNYDRSVNLLSQVADIYRGRYGPWSSEYAKCLSNLGAAYHEWAEVSGDTNMRALEAQVKQQALEITMSVLGPRHPSTGSRINNIAIMQDASGDTLGAIENMKRVLAIDVSLNQFVHQNTKVHFMVLAHFLEKTQQNKQRDMIMSGDWSIIKPIAIQVEKDQNDWVSEDTDSRNFGPNSSISKIDFSNIKL